MENIQGNGFFVQIPSNYQKPLLPGRDKICHALRSGKFKQQKNSLCVDDMYCCLGLISKLQGRLRKLTIEEYTGGNTAYLTLVTGKHTDGDTPHYTDLASDNPLNKIINRSGVFPDGVWVNHIKNEEFVRQETSLMGCNDNGLTFPQIADIIEIIWDNAPDEGIYKLNYEIPVD